MVSSVFVSVKQRVSSDFKPKRSIFSILFVAILTCFAFWPALDNNFLHWDDQFYVTANNDVLRPNAKSLRAIPTKIVSLNYHPITMLSLWTNAKMSGASSAQPFIATNVFLHILNAALVFLLAFKISNSKWLVALTTSLVFALHPMHVESVVWVSERKDVLFAFFFLLSLLNYWKYVTQQRWLWYVVCFFLFLIACLSKATAVSLVPCLFLLDYVAKTNTSVSRLFVEKIPFVGLALVVGIVALDVQSGGDFYGCLEKSEAVSAHNSQIGMVDRMRSACFAHFYYLKKFVVPVGHSAFHPYSLMENYNLLVCIGVALVTLVSIAWVSYKQRRQVLFGLGFYGLTIVLLLQFIPVGSAVVAERYTYLAYIGLAYLLGLVLQIFANMKGSGLSIALLLLIAIVCICCTRIQSDKWQDHLTLFEQALEEYPRDVFIRKTLASGYWAEGHVDKALEHISFAVDALGLVTSESLELSAHCYADLGEEARASILYDEAVALDEANVSARYHRGLNRLSIDPEGAIADFDYCEHSQDAYFLPLIYGPRGRAHGVVGHFEAAIRDLSQAIELSPDDYRFYLDRAVTFERAGKEEEAISDYLRVLKTEPGHQYASERLRIIRGLGKVVH